MTTIPAALALARAGGRNAKPVPPQGSETPDWAMWLAWTDTRAAARARSAFPDYRGSSAAKSRLAAAFYSGLNERIAP